MNLNENAIDLTRQIDYLISQVWHILRKTKIKNKVHFGLSVFVIVFVEISKLIIGS